MKKLLSSILAFLFIIGAVPAAAIGAAADDPARMYLNQESYEDYVGRSFDLYTYFDPYDYYEDCTWETSDDSVVSLSYWGGSYCDVDLVGEGEATVTAKTESGLTAACSFKVKGYPVIELGQTEYVPVGSDCDTALFAFTPSEDGWYRISTVDGVGKRITLYSSEGYYIRNGEYVDENDYILDYRMTAGETYVYHCEAYYYGEAENYGVRVDKMVPADGITLDIVSYEGYPCDGFKPKVSYSPDLAIREDVNWFSSDSSVAEIYSSDGYVYLKSPGTAVITASTESGLSAECAVSVLTPGMMALDTVMTATVPEYGARDCFVFVPEEDMTVELVSTSPDLYTECTVIDSDGYDVGYGSYGGEGGNFKFTAELSGGRTYYVRPGLNRSVSDYPAIYEFTAYRLFPAESLSFAEGTEGEATLGDSVHLTPVFSPERSKTEYIYWNSSDDEVASVWDGSVYLNKPGETVITATTSETGLKAEYHLTVKDYDTIVPGETKSVTVSNDKPQTFRFVAPEAGTYVLSAPEDEDNYIYVYFTQESGSFDYTSKWPGDKEFCYFIKTDEGASVLFRVNTYSDDPVSIDLTLVKLPAAEAVVLPETVEVGFGDDIYVEAQFLPEGCAEESITWTSSDESVVSVDEYGSITAEFGGTATLTAVTENGLTATCTVIVNMPPVLSENEPADVTARYGDDSREFIFKPAEDGEYRFMARNISNNNDIGISVSRVQGWNVASGTTKVTASLSADCWYKVRAYVDYYSEDPESSFELWSAKTVPATDLSIVETYSYKYLPGYSVQLEANAEPWNGEAGSVSWSSSDEAVATVDNWGDVDLIAPGVVTITASTDDGLSAEYELTVFDRPAISSLSFNRTTINAVVGDPSIYLYTYAEPDDHKEEVITWTSSDETVAQVDDKGNVTFVGVGKATVTATSESGASAICTVNVKDAIILTEGEPARVTIIGNSPETARFTPSKDGEYVFGISERSNNNRVSMEIRNVYGSYVGWTSTGIFRTYLSSDVTYSVTLSFDSYSGEGNGSFDLTVAPAVSATGVTINEGEARAEYVGGEICLTAGFEPWNARREEIVWTSADETVATVNENGTVTCVAPGETTVTASTESGLSASIIIRSVARPTLTAIKIKKTVSGYVGDKYEISPQPVPSEALVGDLVWASADETVAAVDEYGVVTFIAPGETVVTATNENGMTASCTVKVRAPIVLTEDVPQTVAVENNNQVKIVFTPGTTGNYRINSSNLTGDARIVNFYFYDQDGSYIEDGYKILNVNLEADRTYFIYAQFSSYYRSGNGTFDITASLVCDPTAISVAGGGEFSGYVGMTTSLEVNYEPWNARYESVTWSTSDATVASVTSGGQIKLNEIGSATVTATTESGLTASVTVNVIEPEIIGLGETKTAQINVAGGCTCFKFIPEEDGVYAFFSDSDIDTVGYVRDENWNELCYNDDGGRNNNFRAKLSMTAGKTYILEARYYSGTSTGSFDVSIVAAKKADSITILQNPDRTEYVSGFVREAIAYDGLKVAVNWTDGTSDEWTYDGDTFTVGGENISVDSSGANAGYFTVSCDGVTANVMLDLIDNPVESIEVVSGTGKIYYEEVNGYYNETIDPATLETVRIFHYRESTPDDAEVAVRFKDGTVKNVKVGEKLDGYSVRWTSGQDETPWTLGDNPTTVSYLGHEATLFVTVQPNPVESIEVVSGSVIPRIENVDGYVSDRYDPLIDEYVEYFRYYADTENVVILIRFCDGTTKEARLYDSVNGMAVSLTDTQSETPWTLGSENYLTVTYCGRSTTIPAEVVPNPVAGIELLSAPTYSYIIGESEYMSVANESFRPTNYTGMSIRVNYTDGTSKVFGEDELRSGNLEERSFSIRAGFPGGPDPAFPVTLGYMGFEVTYTVPVVESPIASLEIVKLPDDPSYATYCDPDFTGMKIKINRTDGTSATVTLGGSNYSYRASDYYGIVIGFDTPDGSGFITRRNGELTATLLGKSCPITGLTPIERDEIVGFKLVKYSSADRSVTATVTFEGGAKKTFVLSDPTAEVWDCFVYRTDEGFLRCYVFHDERGVTFVEMLGPDTIIEPSGQFSYYHDYESGVLRITGYVGLGTTANMPEALFGDPIDTIVEGAFAERPDLKEIRFAGTRAKWNELVGGKDIGLAPGVKIVCADDNVPHVHSYTAVVTPPTCTEQGYTTYICSCGESYVDTYVAALGHDFGEWRVTTAPTCTETGVKTRTCTRCGAAETDDVPATGHSYTDSVTEPTCTEQGYTTHTCTVCGAGYTDTYVAALGHDFGEWIVTTEPTCTETGVKTRTCSRCGAAETGEVGVIAHDYAEIVTPPTCTEQGFTTHACTMCGANYVDTFVAALGHDFAEWAVTTDPTCTEPGVKTRVCTRCGAAETGDVPALGHDYVDTVTEPTCTEQGYTTHTCTRCEESYVDAYVPAAGHNWGPWTVIIPSTETEEGLERRVCLNDPSHVEERVIPVGEHVHALNEIAEVPATCTAAGNVRYYVCSGCGRLFSDSEGGTEIGSEDTVIPALGHDYTETVTEPTCTAQGYTTHVCSRCGDTYTDARTPALGHDYTETVTAPTCTEQGYTTHVCSRCEVSYTDAQTPALGHDYTASVTEPTCTAQGYTTYVCSRCGDSYTDAQTEALGHDYAASVTAPTCTEQGYTTYTCSRCGDSYTGDFIAALGHDFGKNNDAEKCARCGEKNPNYTPVVIKFKDVPSDAFYAKPVEWAVAHNITAGTSKDTFSPNKGCTRGQVVTFLWRAAGEPEPESTANPFVDVKSTDYFFKAVLWAVENNITKGTSKTKFSPSDICTRGQIVTFLHRANGSPKPKSSANPFTDVKSTDYFYDAVLWAVENDITKGTSKTKFSPSDICTRGQVVTFLYRDMN